MEVELKDEMRQLRASNEHLAFMLAASSEDRRVKRYQYNYIRAQLRESDAWVDEVLARIK